MKIFDKLVVILQTFTQGNPEWRKAMQAKFDAL